MRQDRIVDKAAGAVDAAVVDVGEADSVAVRAMELQSLLVRLAASRVNAVVQVAADRVVGRMAQHRLMPLGLEGIRVDVARAVAVGAAAVRKV